MKVVVALALALPIVVGEDEKDVGRFGRSAVFPACVGPAVFDPEIDGGILEGRRSQHRRRRRRAGGVHACQRSVDENHAGWGKIC